MAHTAKERAKAFELYCQHGEIAAVEKLTSIPNSTLHKWRQEENWDDRALELRKEAASTVCELFPPEMRERILNLYRHEHLMCHLLFTKALLPVIQGIIKPKNWSDVMSTFKFIREMTKGRKPDESETLEEQVKRLEEEMKRIQEVQLKSFKEEGSGVDTE